MFINTREVSESLRGLEAVEDCSDLPDRAAVAVAVLVRREEHWDARTMAGAVPSAAVAASHREGG